MMQFYAWHVLFASPVFRSNAQAFQHRCSTLQDLGQGVGSYLALGLVVLHNRDLADKITGSSIHEDQQDPHVRPLSACWQALGKYLWGL